MNEFEKMQKIAGLITENQNSTSSKKIRFEDLVDDVVSEVNNQAEGDNFIDEDNIDKILTFEDLVEALISVGFNNEVEAYKFILNLIVE
jgi:hypothetical protein